jgi:glycine cleavage system H protein
MNVPENLKYTGSHEWVRQDGADVTVGITDFAQDQLGDIVFVELPQPGQQVQAGAQVAVVESVKTASDIYAPLSGTVTAVNPALAETPELVNRSPYQDGWLFRLSPRGGGEDLLDAEAYLALTRDA